MKQTIATLSATAIVQSLIHLFAYPAIIMWAWNILVPYMPWPSVPMFTYWQMVVICWAFRCVFRMMFGNVTINKEEK